MAPRYLYEGCFSALDSIAVVERVSVQTQATQVQTSLSQLDPVVLTSYDLLPSNGISETIVVPGSPAIWTPQPLPMSLRPDGVRPLIREAFHSYPMEPLFRAISVTAPDTDLNSFDIITDRRNLRLLMDFASYRGQNQQEFRFDAEIIGNSLILSRWIDWQSRRSNSGYGLEFEKAFSKAQDCSRASVVHKRAIGYTLGGLRILVRFEVDACIGASAETLPSEEIMVTPNGHRLILSGSLTNEAEVAEIKTAVLGNATLPKVFEQMWLSRTPILCQGFHRNGVFEKVVVTNVQDQQKLSQWEERNGERLGSLVQILKRLKATMKATMTANKRKQFAIICAKRSTSLKLYKLQDTYPFGLPPDLRNKWPEEEDPLASGLEHLSI